MGSCQNYGPLLGTLNIRCRIRIGIQKGTLILTTTHIEGANGSPTTESEVANELLSKLLVSPLIAPVVVPYIIPCITPL